MKSNVFLFVFVCLLVGWLVGKVCWFVGLLVFWFVGLFVRSFVFFSCLRLRC